MSTSTIHHLHIEAAATRGHVRLAFDAATRAGEVLQHIGETTCATINSNPFVDAEADELDRRASKLEGLALHALHVTLELASQSGRLRQLADLHGDAQDLPEE